MENIPKNIMTIMHASLVIFQTYKNVILRRVNSLGWLFWLYFYPSFYFLWKWPIYHVNLAKVKKQKLMNEKEITYHTYD